MVWCGGEGCGCDMINKRVVTVPDIAENTSKWTNMMAW